MSVEQAAAIQRLVATRDRQITEALAAAVAPAELWKVSTWHSGLWRSCAVNPEIADGGTPITEIATTASELSASLEEYAPTYVGPKDRGNLILAYATHVAPERGGHRDEDCQSITGLILDCDAGGSPEKLAVALMRLGLSFTLSMKPATGKFHIIVQVKEMPVPRERAGLVRYGYAREHQSLFGFAINKLSELAGVVFDPAMSGILMHIDFPACRRSEGDPMPLFDGYNAGVLDLEKFCSELGYQPPPVQRRPKPTPVETSDAKTVGVVELRALLENRMRGLKFRGYSEKTFKHAERLQAALAGEAPVPDGQNRNTIWYREIIGTAGVACAQKYPKISVEDLAALLTELFTPAMEAQHEVDLAAKRHLSPRDADHLEEMFCRSMRDIRAKG